MPAPIRPVDEHGFPIPAKFDDPPAGEGEPRRGRRSVFQRLGRWRWLLLLVPVLLFGRQLVDFGRDLYANFQLQRAERDFESGNLPGALAHVDRAISWEPDPVSRARSLLLRGRIHTELHDLDRAMSDCDAAIALLNDRKPPMQPSLELAKAYGYRGWLHERFSQHRQALDDCKVALELCPPGFPDEHSGLLNTRAYVCALSGAELESGLHDIEQAIIEVGENPAFLDTRGYLHFRLGGCQLALNDLQSAIRRTEQDRLRFRLDWEPDPMRAPAGIEGVLARARKTLDEDLAVMYHHRGEVYQKLGEDEKSKDHADYKRKADIDLRRADQLGFDPKNGVL